MRVQWEYHELATRYGGLDAATLTSHGQEGWELTAIYERRDHFDRRELVAVFKRPVAEDTAIAKALAGQ